jgi:arylsulfatase A
MFRLSSLLLFSIVTLTPIVAPAADERPNIVIILADDFGVGDIQAHYPDNKIATPHLDRLVGQGMSFTDAHSPSAVCSPTRYGLLTGRYSWRTRLQEWVIAVYEPPLITADRPTLPKLLKQRGYNTSCIGKWHLGWNWAGPQPSRMTEVGNGQRNLSWDFTKPILGGPTQRGFDYFFGVDLPNLPPFCFIENDRVTVQPTAKYQHDPSEGLVLPKGFAGAPMAPCWKMQGILPEITRRAVKHIHEQAKKDAPFFLYFSQTSPHEPVSPSEDFIGKSAIAPIADFVMETDWSAGQITKAIDDAGIADNTLVIFSADNGHSHYTGWPDLIKAGHMPSGPYRGHKGDIWEGGHRVPLILRWPKHIAAGSSSKQMVSLTDLFATCAEITGAELPEDGAEDSISFLPTALGKTSAKPRTSLVNHSNHGEFAWREGLWKLVFKENSPNYKQSRGQPTIVELYHLEEDIAEENNLVSKHPEIVKRMTAQLSEVITRGASRPGLKSTNDTDVRFDTIQMLRWAPAAK